MKTRSLVVLVGVGALLVCASVFAFAACGGKGGEKTDQKLPPADVIRSSQRIPDLQALDKPAAEVVSQKQLSAEETRAAVDADPKFQDLAAYAGELGLGEAAWGMETTYSNGIESRAAVLGTPGQGQPVAAVVRATGPVDEAYLVTVAGGSEDKPLTLDIITREGKATLNLDEGQVVTSAPGGSCLWHECAGSAVTLMWESSDYGAFMQATVRLCAIAFITGDEPGAALFCPPALVTVSAMLIASGVDCAIDPCDVCYSDACGEDDMGATACGGPYGGAATVYQHYTHYTCEDPGTLDSQCVPQDLVKTIKQCPGGCASGSECAPPPTPPPECQNDADCPPAQIVAGPTCYFVIELTPSAGGQSTSRLHTVVQVYQCKSSRCVPYTMTQEQPCQWGCSADRNSCAAPPPSCVPGGCERPDEPFGSPRCVLRPDDSKWILEQDYRHWACNPVQGGYNSTCEQTVITKVEQECPAGCAADGTSCIPVCDPSTCDREVPEGGSRCVYSYAEGYVVEQGYRKYSCSPLPDGGSTCDSSTYTKIQMHCPYGCDNDATWCGAGAGGGNAPAAPTDFIALQHAGGTRFEWHDRSDNEDGFRIYFGARSLGRPSTLIATAGPNTSSLDTDFVRSGGECLGDLRLQRGRRVGPGPVLPSAVAKA